MSIKFVSNWGRYPVKLSEFYSFSTLAELALITGKSGKFIARGNGRCYGDASLSECIISTLRFNKMLFFDKENGIFECQSGVCLDEILEIIVPNGWFLPVTPGTKFITIGGAVASDIHGKNHHIDGSFSRHIIELDVFLSSGITLTCSRTLNSDLFYATCGGMGLTGIISKVKFKLKKIETAFIKQKQIKASNLEETLTLFEDYKHYTYSVAWIDCLKEGKSFGRSILILGEHAKTEDMPFSGGRNPLNLKRKKILTFPFNLPSFALNRFTVSLFNFLYYNKNFNKEINNVVSYEPFFYPLDAILNWNRGYGKKGFVQYQFVLPRESKSGLIQILKKITEKKYASFLAVLKVFGPQKDLISFPEEGYTLALDIPIRPGLFDFLNELDELVVSFGGRIYLTKDARMNAVTFHKSYPNVNEFQKILKKYNPNTKFGSLLSERLNIADH